MAASWDKVCYTKRRLCAKWKQIIAMGHPLTLSGLLALLEQNVLLPSKYRGSVAFLKWPSSQHVNDSGL